jgi:hypothetical protein
MKTGHLMQRNAACKRPHALARRGFIAMCILLLLTSGPAGAAMFNASSVEELIVTIDAANQNDEPDSISLAAGTTFTLTEVNNTMASPTGLPMIAAGQRLTILGNGSIIERSTVTGTPSFRLFDVAAGASLALENLTLQGARANDLASIQTNGGAIRNAGDLALTSVIVQHNSAQGRNGAPCVRCDRGSAGGTAWWGYGGGIYSSGSLLLENSTIDQNQAVGGRGGTGPARGGRGGDGFGGGIYVAAGTATLRNSVVTGNAALRGAGGQGYQDAPDGLPGQGVGGGIYIAATAQVNLDEFTIAHITGNTASNSFPDIRGSYEIIPHANPVAGDFNGDGSVDARDYAVWRKGLGTLYTQNDYNVWRAHFGQTAIAGVSAGAIIAVPEPTGFAMLVVATITCSIANVRRRHNLTIR